MTDNNEIHYGRPKADIDWQKVDQLLVAGCSGVEIAGYFGLKPATLYDRCFTDHATPFSVYSQEKQAKGDSILRAVQFEKACGITEKGDNTMLVWLGKTRLKQKEEKTIALSEEDAKSFEALMNHFHLKQKPSETDDSASLTKTD